MTRASRLHQSPTAGTGCICQLPQLTEREQIVDLPLVAVARGGAVVRLTCSCRG
jgi:hypothetical protein